MVVVCLGAATEGRTVRSVDDHHELDVGKLSEYLRKYSKTCLKRTLKKDQTLFLRTNVCLMQVKSIAECNTFDLH